MVDPATRLVRSEETLEIVTGKPYYTYIQRDSPCDSRLSALPYVIDPPNSVVPVSD